MFIKTAGREYEINLALQTVGSVNSKSDLEKAQHNATILWKDNTLKNSIHLPSSRSLSGGTDTESNDENYKKPSPMFN
jgi:hypothetical protein